VRIRHLVTRSFVIALLLPFGLACGMFGGGGNAGADFDQDFADMPSAEELFAEGSAKLDDGSNILWVLDTTDYQGAIDKFQDIVDNYPYSEYATLAELRIADAFFQQGLYEEALSYYRDFAELHPDHEKVPYTIYRAALCHYNESRNELRDQSATRKSLEFLDKVMTQYPYSPEAAEAETLWRDLRTRLARHTLMIADFYLDRDEYQSAADRYRSVLNEYPGLGLDAQALYKLGVCYSHMSLEDEAQKVFQVILENYQGSEIAEAAQDWVPSAN
jgi:outer membrane protein assembly factor BamD